MSITASLPDFLDSSVSLSERLGKAEKIFFAPIEYPPQCKEGVILSWICKKIKETSQLRIAKKIDPRDCLHLWKSLNKLVSSTRLKTLCSQNWMCPIPSTFFQAIIRILELNPGEEVQLEIIHFVGECKLNPALSIQSAFVQKIGRSLLLFMLNYVNQKPLRNSVVKVLTSILSEMNAKVKSSPFMETVFENLYQSYMFLCFQSAIKLQDFNGRHGPALCKELNKMFEIVRCQEMLPVYTKVLEYPISDNEGNDISATRESFYHFLRQCIDCHNSTLGGFYLKEFLMKFVYAFPDQKALHHNLLLHLITLISPPGCGLFTNKDYDMYVKMLSDSASENSDQKDSLIEESQKESIWIFHLLCILEGLQLDCIDISSELTLDSQAFLENVIKELLTNNLTETCLLSIKLILKISPQSAVNVEHLLNIVMRKPKMGDGACRIYGHLLCDILSIYNKMRKLEEFFKILLSILDTLELSEQSIPPLRFSETYLENFVLPLNLMEDLLLVIGRASIQVNLSIWSTVIEQLKNYCCNATVKHGSKNLGLFLWLISECVGVNYFTEQMTLQTLASSVAQSMNEFANVLKEVFGTIIHPDFGKTDAYVEYFVVPFLRVCYTWGELHQRFLRTDTGYCTSTDYVSNHRDDCKKAHDFIQVPFITHKWWMKLHKKFQNSNNASLQIMTTQLLFQKVAILNFEEKIFSAMLLTNKDVSSDEKMEVDINGKYKKSDDEGESDPQENGSLVSNRKQASLNESSSLTENDLSSKLESFKNLKSDCLKEIFHPNVLKSESLMKLLLFNAPTLLSNMSVENFDLLSATMIEGLKAKDKYWIQFASSTCFQESSSFQYSVVKSIVGNVKSAIDRSKKRKAKDMLQSKKQTSKRDLLDKFFTEISMSQENVPCLELYSDLESLLSASTKFEDQTSDEIKSKVAELVSILDYLPMHHLDGNMLSNTLAFLFGLLVNFGGLCGNTGIIASLLKVMFEICENKHLSKCCKPFLITYLFSERKLYTDFVKYDFATTLEFVLDGRDLEGKEVDVNYLTLSIVSNLCGATLEEDAEGVISLLKDLSLQYEDSSEAILELLFILLAVMEKKSLVCSVNPKITKCLELSEKILKIHRKESEDLKSESDVKPECPLSETKGLKSVKSRKKSKGKKRKNVDETVVKLEDEDIQSEGTDEGPKKKAEVSSTNVEEDTMKIEKESDEEVINKIDVETIESEDGNPKSKKKAKVGICNIPEAESTVKVEQLDYEELELNGVGTSFEVNAEGEINTNTKEKRSKLKRKRDKKERVQVKKDIACNAVDTAANLRYIKDISQISVSTISATLSTCTMMLNMRLAVKKANKSTEKQLLISLISKENDVKQVCGDKLLSLGLEYSKRIIHVKNQNKYMSILALKHISALAKYESSTGHISDIKAVVKKIIAEAWKCAVNNSHDDLFLPFVSSIFPCTHPSFLEEIVKHNLMKIMNSNDYSLLRWWPLVIKAETPLNTPITAFRQSIVENLIQALVCKMSEFDHKTSLLKENIVSRDKLDHNLPNIHALRKVGSHSKDDVIEVKLGSRDLDRKVDATSSLISLHSQWIFHICDIFSVILEENLNIDEHHIGLILSSVFLINFDVFDEETYEKVYATATSIIVKLQVKRYSFVENRITIVTAIIKNLTSSLARKSRQKNNLNAIQIKSLESLAFCLERIVHGLKKFNVTASKVAPLCLSSVLEIMSHIHVYQPIKAVFERIVFILIDIGDDHGIKHLMVALPPSSTNLLRHLHSEYKEHYKYKPKQN